MKRCKRCVITDTRPGISFHEDGICFPCRYWETRDQIDWDKRRAELDDYKKDEITDEQILNDDIFEKAKLEKANLDSKTTQSDEKPIVGTKTKGDDFYAQKRKKVDEYIENRLKKNKEELEKAKINVE